jgi:DNA-binding IclR family transcriptional regulator
MARSSRLIVVLQLFENNRPVWTVDEISRTLGISVSTAYRHVRELVGSGFLDPVTGAGYALGPAFIRYDRILRQSDPLIQIAHPVMAALLDRTRQNGTVALCRRFKDCVMCVHEVRGKKSRGQTSYERGVAMPMFLGATSKVILAQLPDRVLRGVYLANEKTIRQVLRTRDWSEFKSQLREIRRSGFALTDSEVAKGRVGLAAPIGRNGQVAACISLIVDANGWDKKKVSSFIPHVVGAAQSISRSLIKEAPVISR